MDWLPVQSQSPPAPLRRHCYPPTAPKEAMQPPLGSTPGARHMAAGIAPTGEQPNAAPPAQRRLGHSQVLHAGAGRGAAPPQGRQRAEAGSCAVEGGWTMRCLFLRPAAQRQRMRTATTHAHSRMHCTPTGAPAHSEAASSLSPMAGGPCPQSPPLLRPLSGVLPQPPLAAAGGV